MWYKVSWLFFWATMMLWLGNFWGCASSGDEQNYKILHENRPSSPTEVDPGVGAVKSTSGVLPHTGFAFLKKDEPVNYDKTLSPVPAHRQQKVSVASVETQAGNTAGDAPKTETDKPVTTDAKTATPAAPVDATDKSVAVKSSDTGVNTDEPPAEVVAVSTLYHSDSIELPEATEPSLKGLDRSHWKKISTGPTVAQTLVYPHYFDDYKPDREREKVDFNTSVKSQLHAALDGPFSNNWDKHHAASIVIQPVKFAHDLIIAPVRMVRGESPWKKVATPDLSADDSGYGGEAKTEPESDSKAEPAKKDEAKADGGTG